MGTHVHKNSSSLGHCKMKNCVIDTGHLAISTCDQ